MLSNIANKLTKTFPREAIVKEQTLPRTKTVQWPSDCTVSGEPLFTVHLTEADLSALEESAGLGSPSWWLDPIIACQDPDFGSPTYEDEVNLTAWMRAPFEQAGPIRDASRKLLERLNGLERLHALAAEENERKLLGREKRVRHHSTLQLADSSVDLRGIGEVKTALKSPPRRDTYAIHKTGGNVCASRLRPPMSPRICISPERRPVDGRIDGSLHRTYSKHSLDRLQTEAADLQRNTYFPPSELSGTSTRLLLRTYDADELSDVFPDVRASNETFDASHPPPPTPSANLPRAVPGRKYATDHHQQRANTSRDSPAMLAMQQEANLRASVSKRSGFNSISVRGSGGDSGGDGRSGQIDGVLAPTRFRESLPNVLPVAATHKTSAPECGAANLLHTSLPNPLNNSTGSGSKQNIPTNMNETLEVMRQQEKELRVASAGCGGSSIAVNVSLTSSLDGSRESGIDRLNKKSLPSHETRRFQSRETGPKDIPTRYEPKRLASVSSIGNISHSGSDSRLKSMTSLLAIVSDQAEGLRLSGEEALKKSRSKSSLNRSMDSMKNFSDSASERIASPQRGSISAIPPLVPEPSDSGPKYHCTPLPPHQHTQNPNALNDSRGTYDLAESRDTSVGAPRPSSSPVHMRRPTRLNAPPPLCLPIDTEVITPEGPHTGKTIRPSSYAEQLHSAKHASSAVEAWVNETLGMDAENPCVGLSFSEESFTTASDANVRDSTDTYAIPNKLTASSGKKPTSISKTTGLMRQTTILSPTSPLLKSSTAAAALMPKSDVMTTSNHTLKPTQALIGGRGAPSRGRVGLTTSTQRSLAPKAVPTARGGASRDSALRPPTTASARGRLRNPNTTVSGARPPIRQPMDVSSSRLPSHGQPANERSASAVPTLPPTASATSLPRRVAKGRGTIRVSTARPKPPPFPEY